MHELVQEALGEISCQAKLKNANSHKTAAHMSSLWAEQSRVGLITEMSVELHGTAWVSWHCMVMCGVKGAARCWHGTVHICVLR